MKIKSLILCLFAVGLGWAWSGAAQATVIDLQFTGQIISSTLGDPAFAAGTAYAGDLIYDLSAQVFSPDPSLGFYSEGTSLTGSFSTGATCVGQPSIIVGNNSAGKDSFKVVDFTVTGSSLPLIPSLEFNDSSQTVFTSVSLPVSFILSDFDFGIQGKGLWILCEGQPQKYALGSITSISFNQTGPVPLPASILLFGTALGGWLVVGTIRRSKRFL